MGRPWSNDDVQCATELYNMGWPLQKIAQYLLRSPQAVCYKLSKVDKLQLTVVSNQDQDSNNLDNNIDADIDTYTETCTDVIGNLGKSSSSYACQYLTLGIVTGILIGCGSTVYTNILCHSLSTLTPLSL